VLSSLQKPILIYYISVINPWGFGVLGINFTLRHLFNFLTLLIAAISQPIFVKVQCFIASEVAPFAYILYTYPCFNALILREIIRFECYNLFQTLKLIDLTPNTGRLLHYLPFSELE
jgi:hypothetical protein